MRPFTTGSSSSSLSSSDSSSSLLGDDRRFLQTRKIEPPNFVKVWDDNGTCFKPFDCTVWSPIAPEGFFILGDVLERGQNSQPRKTVALAVRDPNPGLIPPLVQPPLDYKKMWDSRGTGCKYGDITMWWPIPPPGYVACGVVITTSLNVKPGDDGRTNIACILQEAAARAHAQPEEEDSKYLWATLKNPFRTFALNVFKTNPYHKYISIWSVHPATEDGVRAGTFFVTDVDPTVEQRTGLWCPANAFRNVKSAAEARICKGFRYESFVPPRRNVRCQWFIDGESYYETVADALERAESEIFIAGWCVSPELYLRRRQPIRVGDRLDMILRKMARKGVSVFVLLWWDTEMTVGGTVNSFHAMTTLEALHPNIRVIRHPGGKGKVYWTHHQKFVVIDQEIAFVGGIDMCFGRFDNGAHTLLDTCHMNLRFPGKDYYQPRVEDFTDLEHPFNDLVDRTKVPRMPWHDIHCYVNRDGARDLALNFIQRWNHHLRKKVQGGDRNYRDYPVLAPSTAPFPANEEFQGGTCDIQILRSVGQWSLGSFGGEARAEEQTERSIQNCYLDLIRNAQHFIYIENQYFISNQNGIANALFERVCLAIDRGETFRIFVLIPITPCGSWETSSIRCVMKWQYETISRGGNSLREKIQARYAVDKPDLDVNDYVGFFSLRNLAILDDEIVADQIYIHSKLIIVDDRIVLIGTANINDRSMCGDRDSEIAVVVRDNEFVEGRMDGKFYLAAKFAHTLRMSLFMEHLGLVTGEESLVLDPVHSSFYNKLWWTRASENQRLFTSIFRTTPSDNFMTIAEVQSMEKIIQNMSHEERMQDKQNHLKQLAAIKGHLVAYPLHFLEREVLDSGFNIEAFLPGWVYQ